MKPSHILGVATAIVFCCYGMAFAENWKHDARKGNPHNAPYTHGHRDKKADRHYDRKPAEVQHVRGEHHPPDYHRYSGYRETPYERDRHYGHYMHLKHRYDYRGHWSSWKRWQRYVNAHPEIIRYGHYYRESAHLMFRFCDPGTGNCCFFSIGR